MNIFLIIITLIVVFVFGSMWGMGIMCYFMAAKRRQRIFTARHLRRPIYGNLWSRSYPVADPLERASNISARATQIGGDHYRNKKIQPWDAMEEWMSAEQFKGFLRGNVIKYMARCDDKGGLVDIKKAGHYLNKLQETQK